VPLRFLQRLPVRFALVPIFVALAVACTRACWPFLGSTPFLLLWGVVGWAAYDHRRGPSQLAIGLGMAGAYWFLPSSAGGIWHVVLFGVTTVLAAELIMGRVRSRQALADSEFRFRAFFETDLVANFIATPEGRLLAWNARFAALMNGVESSSDLQSLLDADTYAAMRERIAQGSSLWRPSLVIHRPGEPVRVDARFMGIRNAGGQLQSIAGCLVDMTERYRVNAQIQRWQKLDALERLVVGLVHHFKNLLAIIVGRADVLAAQIDDHSPLRRDVQEMQRAAARANTLTTQLVAFSRQELLQPAIVDVNALVLATVDSLPRAADPAIFVDAGLSRSPCLAEVDAARFEQMLRSLAANACEALPQGGHVTFETAIVDLATPPLNREEVTPGCYVQLAVSDTGVGMPPEVRGRLFEPFFTTRPPGESTGLSLATAYGLVRQSGGFIEVYSRPGQGTTFEIYLPSADARSVPDAAITGSLVFDFGTILLVSHDGDRRARLMQLLRRYDYSVIEVANVSAALAALRAGQNVHAALLDARTADDAAALLGAQPALKILTLPDGPILPLAVIRRIREALSSPV